MLLQVDYGGALPEYPRGYFVRIVRPRRNALGPLLLSRPMPCSQVITPCQPDAGEIVKAATRISLPVFRSVKEHDVHPHPGNLARIEHEGRSDPSAGPGPIVLSQRDSPEILPAFQVGGTLYADPALRRVNHYV